MIRQSISIPPGAVTTVGPPHIFTEQDAATSPFDPAPEGGAAKGVEVQLVQNPGDIAAYLILQGSNFLAKTGLGASPDALNLVFKMGDIEVKVGSEEFSFVGDREFGRIVVRVRSEEHTSELQSLMRTSYAVFCLKKKKYDH